MKFKSKEKFILSK